MEYRKFGLYGGVEWPAELASYFLFHLLANLRVLRLTYCHKAFLAVGIEFLRRSVEDTLKELSVS